MQFRNELSGQWTIRHLVILLILWLTEDLSFVFLYFYEINSIINSLFFTLNSPTPNTPSRSNWRSGEAFHLPTRLSPWFLASGTLTCHYSLSPTISSSFKPVFIFIPFLGLSPVLVNARVYKDICVESFLHSISLK